MYDTRLTIESVGVVTDRPTVWVPLAALGAPEEPLPEPVMPLAYVPRIPEGRTYRELLERAVAWGRR